MMHLVCCCMVPIVLLVSVWQIAQHMSITYRYTLDFCIIV